MTRLHGTEFVTWLLLRRVHRGGLATLGDRHLNHGRPLPSYLPPNLLAELTMAGLLTEADPDESGMQRISLTDAGQAQYAELCQRQHGPDLPIPPPEFATTTETPAGRRSSSSRFLLPAASRTETLCGNTLPPDIPTADRPSGECIPCVIGFAAALPDPGRMGTAR